MNKRPQFVVINNKEEEKEEQMTLKVIGGNGGGIDRDWLSKLELGSIFLIQDNQSADFNLGHFKLVDKTEKACILASSLSPNPIFVDPARFCQKYRKFEDLGIFVDEAIAANAAAEEEDDETDLSVE